MNRGGSIVHRNLFLVMLLFAVNAWGQELKLLTDNGLTNEKFSTYRDARFLRSGGKYVVNPLLASDRGAGDTFPFAGGTLTNGDASFTSKREPGPYSYWQSAPRGEVVFDLLKPYRVGKVRVCVLNSGPHGTERVELYKKGDPLEFPEALKMGELRAQDGWNEFTDLDTILDGIRLVLTLQKGKTYLTVSEVEIWGSEGPAQAVASSPQKVGDKSIREGSIEWYAFDFGPKDSPVFANFTGVDKDVVYHKDRGYGFLPYQDGKPGTPSNFGPESNTVPGLGERDRIGKAKAISDSLYRDFVMTSAYYHTQVRQTFVVDVPNGKYRAITFHGDQEYGEPGEQQWWIEAEEKRVVERLRFPLSRLADAVFDTDVADGQLTLTMDAAHPDMEKRSVLLNGLAVFPINTQQERAFADAKIAKIRAAVQRERDERFASLFTEKPYVEEAPLPPVSAEDEARGFVPFVPHWMATIYPNSVPRPKDLTRPLGCFACPGKCDPMTVAVRSLKDLKGLTCSVSDLSGPEKIPAASVDIRSVKCWPQRLGSSWGTEWRVMPELLEAKRVVDVSHNTTQEFWLTIRVPESAKPGVYRGTATIVATNGGKASIPMTVDVLPFTLERNERPVGMYWYEHKVAGTPVRDVHVKDMVEHGMSAAAIGHIFPEVRNENGKIVLDASKLTKFLQEIKRLGIGGPLPYHTSTLTSKIKRVFPGKSKEEYDALYVEATRQLQDISSRPDTPQLLYYPVDEIGNADDRGRQAHDECALVTSVPGAVSYITVNNYAAGEKWGDTFDIWCGNIEYTAEQEKALLGKGKRYMRYGPAYLNDARKARNSCGFGFYRRPAEAMYYWHYQCYQGDPYNDFDGGCRDHCAAYPSENSELIPTIDWESLREGVDDMRYIATLKHYAQVAAGKPNGKPFADSANRVLADVLAGDDRVNQYTFRDDLSDDDFHALRRKLVDEILKLRKVVQ